MYSPENNLDGIHRLTFEYIQCLTKILKLDRDEQIKLHRLISMMVIRGDFRD